MYCPIADGKKIAMPRYYKDKLYTTIQREQINLHIEKQMLTEAQNRTSADDTELMYIAIKKAKDLKKQQRLIEKL